MFALYICILYDYPFMHMYVIVFMYVHTHTCACLNICIDIYVYTVYIYTYICIYTYDYICFSKSTHDLYVFLNSFHLAGLAGRSTDRGLEVIKSYGK